MINQNTICDQMFLEIQMETQKFSEPIIERISINEQNPLELIEKLQEMPN